jgi:hypothetical protein
LPEKLQPENPGQLLQIWRESPCLPAPGRRLFTFPHAGKVKAGKSRLVTAYSAENPSGKSWTITTDMAGKFRPVTTDTAGKSQPDRTDATVTSYTRKQWRMGRVSS